jgi:hypothetical protein
MPDQVRHDKVFFTQSAVPLVFFIGIIKWGDLLFDVTGPRFLVSILVAVVVAAPAVKELVAW